MPIRVMTRKRWRELRAAGRIDAILKRHGL